MALLVNGRRDPSSGFVSAMEMGMDVIRSVLTEEGLIPPPDAATLLTDPDAASPTKKVSSPPKRPRETGPERPTTAPDDATEKQEKDLGAERPRQHGGAYNQSTLIVTSELTAVKRVCYPKWATKAGEYRWKGFCAVCKRPLDLQTDNTGGGWDGGSTFIFDDDDDGGGVRDSRSSPIPASLGAAEPAPPAETTAKYAYCSVIYGDHRWVVAAMALGKALRAVTNVDMVLLYVPGAVLCSGAIEMLSEVWDCRPLEHVLNVRWPA